MSIDDLLAKAQAQHKRDLYSNREWLCVKCRKRFRFRPEQVEQVVTTTVAPSPMHCGIPLLLTTKAKP
jgi:hypothetical protein